MRIDYKSVLSRAEFYKPAIFQFLRDMIAIPSESCQEKEVIQRVKQEMLSVGFDKVDIDPMGNIIGTIGSGKCLIAFDAHVDTVASAMSTIGNTTPTRDSKTTRSSSAAAPAIRKGAWRPWSMPEKSSRISHWKKIIRFL